MVYFCCSKSFRNLDFLDLLQKSFIISTTDLSKILDPIVWKVLRGSVEWLRITGVRSSVWTCWAKFCQLCYFLRLLAFFIPQNSPKFFCYFWRYTKTLQVRFHWAIAKKFGWLFVKPSGRTDVTWLLRTNWSRIVTLLGKSFKFSTKVAASNPRSRQIIF